MVEYLEQLQKELRQHKAWMAGNGFYIQNIRDIEKEAVLEGKIETVKELQDLVRATLIEREKELQAQAEDDRHYNYIRAASPDTKLLELTHIMRLLGVA